jgi:predicted nucleic acid-binding protein
MAVLILDTEALSALARPRSARQRHERVRAAMRSAERRNEPVRVPSAVLVELYRGAGTDEAIDQVLGRGFARVVTTGVRIARIAGHLLALAGRDSDLAIDALVVATAVRLGGGLVLTHDPGHLELLAANHPNVQVVPV